MSPREARNLIFFSREIAVSSLMRFSQPRRNAPEPRVSDPLNPKGGGESSSKWHVCHAHSCGDGHSHPECSSRVMSTCSDVGIEDAGSAGFQISARISGCSKGEADKG